MNILKFVALCLVAGIITAAGTALAVDAYFWELDGHCLDSAVIHYIMNCRP